jgi:poly-beta-1,6-N-acetyl-D-glucosamine synthase
MNIVTGINRMGKNADQARRPPGRHRRQSGDRVGDRGSAFPPIRAADNSRYRAVAPAVNDCGRDGSGLDAPWELSAPVRDGAITVPFARLTYETDMGTSSATRTAGLKVMQATYDIPVDVELARPWKAATTVMEPRFAHMRQWKSVVTKRQPTLALALVPAHNEETSIEATVASIVAQRRKPDRILVICDNCTDNTELAARRAGAETLVTVGNAHKKAGALNQALALLLPDLADSDMILIQDADTLLNSEFTEAAINVMSDDIGGVCAQYDMVTPHNLLERLQSNEFTRSRRRIGRKEGRTKILVGIAAMFTAGRFREIIAARKAGILPGKPTVYNEMSLTEDYELSLAFRTLGYRLVCPDRCRPLTHAMPTLTKLWHQRVRWSRGGLDDLHVYGVTRVTVSYIAQQTGRTLTMLVPFIYLAYLISLKLTYGHIQWSLPWVLINALFIGERVITVRRAGWRAMWVALILVPELLYDWFMAGAYLSGLMKHLSGSTAQWLET